MPSLEGLRDLPGTRWGRSGKRAEVHEEPINYFLVQSLRLQ